jgi:hypothetical protein
MNGFETMGQTLLQTAEGNRQIAAALTELATSMAGRFKQWVARSFGSSPKSAR